MKSETNAVFLSKICLRIQHWLASKRSLQMLSIFGHRGQIKVAESSYSNSAFPTVDAVPSHNNYCVFRIGYLCFSSEKMAIKNYEIFKKARIGSYQLKVDFCGAKSAHYKDSPKKCKRTYIDFESRSRVTQRT